MTHKQDRNHLKAQLQRASETSRHEISKLAHELLQKRLDERHAANEQSSLMERARVRDEHAVNTIKLATAHEMENKGFEDTRFAMIAEFDIQRDTLHPPPAKKLEAENLRHDILLENLKAELVINNQKAEEVFQQIIQSCNSCARQNVLQSCNICNWVASPSNLSYQTQRINLELLTSYEQIVRKHEAEWKVRQEVLPHELHSRNSYQARLELERDFQLKFAECDQRQKTIQQRQVAELKVLVKEQNSRLAAVQERYERTEAELQEERQRVAEWWKHLCDENVASLRRIDQDETYALDAISLEVTVEADRENQATQVVTSGAAQGLLEKAERAETVSLAAAEEEETLYTSSRILDEQAVILIPHDTTRSLNSAPHGAVDLSGSTFSSTSCDAVTPPLLLLAGTNQLQTTSSSNALSHWSAVSVTSKLQYNLITDQVSPSLNKHRNAITSLVSESGQAGQVQDRCITPESRGSDSDFAEI